MLLDLFIEISFVDCSIFAASYTGKLVERSESCEARRNCVQNSERKTEKSKCFTVEQNNVVWKSMRCLP